jgi:hypothetical protein
MMVVSSISVPIADYLSVRFWKFGGGGLLIEQCSFGSRCAIMVRFSAKSATIASCRDSVVSMRAPEDFR